MNNGCICCTVRGDLIRIIGNLMKRRDQFDHLVIETTDLANPAPVIQTFYTVFAPLVMASTSRMPTA